MRRFWKENLIYLCIALFCTILIMSPYLFKDFLGIEHDTFFHLSRIQGLAEAISRGDFLPALYPYKNNGFGYASSLFYSDFLLIPSALLYLAGCSFAFCYKQFVVAMTFLSIFHMELLVKHVLKKKSAVVLSGFAYAFANYRITDIYVRGALGEVTALAFLPVLILGMYEILYEQRKESWPILCAGISFLAVSHNLSFLFGVILCILLFCIRLKSITKELFLSLCKAVGLAFLLTCFFTIPMIEQTFSQDFVLKYWGSDMGSHSMDLWQYFANTTVFGYGGNQVSSGKYMLENVGWFLEFSPLLTLFIKEKKPVFVTHCLILGYVFMLLPCSLVPWSYLTFLGILQFPWRLSMIAMTFLVVPSVYAVTRLANKKILFVILVALTLEAVYHVVPCFERTFGITSENTYDDIIEGKLCDPYYSADYMRVELAGGDYLNIVHPDFREKTTDILHQDGSPSHIQYEKNGVEITFTTDQENTKLILPLSWYKGYHVYYLDGANEVEIACFYTYDYLVTFTTESAGTYKVVYENTLLRSVCLWVSFGASLGSLCLAILSFSKKKRNL